MGVDGAGSRMRDDVCVCVCMCVCQRGRKDERESWWSWCRLWLGGLCAGGGGMDVLVGYTCTKGGDGDKK